ncbi:hypothetical protein C8Q73DRAFT_689832 [Cubamyces lactineus]|nr:hypothetical protein C8Q73DRAFT_689832 [Cubamyces lactineus]
MESSSRSKGTKCHPQVKKRMRQLDDNNLNARSEDASKPVTSVTRPSRGNTGKLASLMHLPMDIFYEVASNLHPLDLLHMARTSKYLRSIVLSRKCKFLWTASLSEIDGLPSCPTGMSEPAYVALVFGRLCLLCGAPRALWVDYAIRLRLCRACRIAHIKPGTQILTDNELSTLAGELSMAMAPCHVKNVNLAKLAEVPFTHRESHLYYAPQLRDLLKSSVNALKDGDISQRHKLALCADAVQMHKVRAPPPSFSNSYAMTLGQHATALLEWELNASRTKSEDRKARIITKLFDLGYTQDDFPNSSEWSKLVEQPTELTERVWKNIRPKLEALIAKERDREASMAFNQRAEARMAQIVPYYLDLAEQLPEPQRAMMPNAIDCTRLPSLVALSKRNNAHGDVSHKDFLALVPDVIQDAEVHADHVRELAREFMLDDARFKDAAEAWKAELTQLPLDELLTRHYALFGCMQPFCPGYFTIEEVHAHWRETHPDVEWGARTESHRFLVKCDGEYALGGEILDAAGLPRDTPISTLTELIQSGRLYCSCGDPSLPPPEELSWPKLFKHIHEETWRYRDRVKTLSNKRDHKYVLNDAHPLTGPNTCIKLLPEGADTAPARERATVIDAKVRKKVEERIAAQPAPPVKLICRVCKTITASTGFKCSRLALPGTPEGIVHHLKTWHDKEFEKLDILYYTRHI